jgi:predicted amidohydrolase YtcJ
MFNNQRTEERTMSADLIVTNANIYTMNPAQPTANAFAVRDGKFIAVGDAAVIDALRGPKSQVLDLAGALVLPGLCDAHLHFTHYGLGLQRIDIFEVPTLAEMLQRVAAKAQQTAAGQWLLGWGWLQTIWPEKRFPTNRPAAKLSTTPPVNPPACCSKGRRSNWWPVTFPIPPRRRSMLRCWRPRPMPTVLG